MYQGIQCYPEVLLYYERGLEQNDGESGSDSDTTKDETLPEPDEEPALAESKNSESSEALRASEELKALHEQNAQAQIALLELQNLNNWYVFQIKEQQSRKLELQGLSKKPPELNWFTLTFTLHHLEQSFRIAHFRTFR